MKTREIEPTYSHVSKQSGQSLEASEWNALSQAMEDTQLAVNSLIEDVRRIPSEGGGGGGEGTGLGYVILNDEEPVASQISTRNTIYIVQTDIDLQDESITMPSNSVLRFEKGSIRNGNIVLDGTRIEGEADFSDVSIEGSCANDVLMPQMFGARPSAIECEENKSQHTLGFVNLASVANNEQTVSHCVYLSSGHYALSSQVSFLRDCKFYGDGDLTVLDLYDGSGGLGFNLIRHNYHERCCTFLPSITIVEDAHKNDVSLALNSVEGLSKGDCLIINDSQSASFNKSRVGYRNGEIIKISDIDDSTNTIYLTHELLGDYYADFGEDYTTTVTPVPQSRTMFSLFTPKQFLVSDIKIYSHQHDNKSISTYYCLSVSGVRDSLFKNITIENYGNSVPWRIGWGLNFLVDNCTVRSFSLVGEDLYGLNISESQGFKVRDSLFRAEHHALATGGGASFCSLVNRLFVYESLTFENSRVHTKDYGIKDLDVHGNAEYYKYFNINAPNLECDTGGYNVIIDNCILKKLTFSFNEGSLLVRNSDIRILDSLVYNENNAAGRTNEIIFENNTIRGFVHLNFEILANELDTAKPYVLVMFRNNIITGGLFLRNAHLENVVVSGNQFDSYGFGVKNIYVDNIIFKDNLIKDGFVQYHPLRLSEGVFTGNTITHITEKYSAYGNYSTVYLTNCKGVFSNNTIKKEIDDTRTLVSLEKCDVNMFANVMTLSNTKGPLVYCSEGTVLLYNNNTTNADEAEANCVRGSSNSRFLTDRACSPEEDFVKYNVPNPWGKTIYFTKLRKNALFSPKKTNLVATVTVSSAAATCVQNVLSGKRSYIAAGADSGNHRLFFSKCAADAPEFNADELLPAFEDLNSNEKVFYTPDPAEYPYLYCVSDRNSDTVVSIYETRMLAEYDGATFGISRSGMEDSRPLGKDIYVGFLYFDSTKGKLLLAKTIDPTDDTVEWVDVVGEKQDGKVDYVDLDLPSKLLWRKYNLGADTPKGTGLFFSWGNTEGHAEGSGYDFTAETYANTPGSQISGSIPLESDAANINLGDGWRMPTSSDIKELVENTDFECVEGEGVKLMKKTDHNVYIFLPFAGRYQGTELKGKDSYCNYLSSKQYDANYAYLMDIGGSAASRNYRYKYYGYVIRPVKENAG